MNEQTISRYKFHRASRRRREAFDLEAHRALYCARADEAAGKTRYAPTLANLYNPEGEAFGTRGRWIEDTSAAGLRLVGMVDSDDRRPAKIATRGNGTGWYLDEHYGDVVRAAVFQLPARNGRAQYVPAYVDPYNDGAAWVAFAELVEGEPGGHGDRWQEADESTQRECAEEAARIAARMAEEERERRAAWDAGRRWSDSMQEAQEARHGLRELVRELRESVAAFVAMPAACKALRADVARRLAELEQSRQFRAGLAAGEGETAGREQWAEFDSRNQRLREAFNEGAGRPVLAI